MTNVVLATPIRGEEESVLFRILFRPLPAGTSSLASALKARFYLKRKEVLFGGNNNRLGLLEGAVHLLKTGHGKLAIAGALLGNPFNVEKSLAFG